MVTSSSANIEDACRNCGQRIERREGAWCHVCVDPAGLSHAPLHSANDPPKGQDSCWDPEPKPSVSTMMKRLVRPLKAKKETAKGPEKQTEARPKAWSYGATIGLGEPRRDSPATSAPSVTAPPTRRQPPKRIESLKNSVSAESFGLFWDRVGGVPSWISLARAGKSPSGYPDDWRRPPKETNMVDDYRKQPHVDEGTKEVWKVWLGFGGLMVAALCAIIISTIWAQVPLQVRIFIIATPYDLSHGNKIVWATTLECVLVMFTALKAREFRSALGDAWAEVSKVL